MKVSMQSPGVERMLALADTASARAKTLGVELIAVGIRDTILPGSGRGLFFVCE